MPGLEDLLFLGAIGAAAYGVYQKIGGATSQPVKQGGKIIKRTYTKPKASVSLENIPVAIGDVYGEIRPYDIEDLPSRDYLPQVDYSGYATPIRIEARIQEQQAVLSAPTGNTKKYLDAGEAYLLCQRGKYTSDVKNALASQFYTWGDIFSPPSAAVGSGRVKSISKQIFVNAQRHAEVLDKIASRYGAKIPIESWVRIQQQGSFHTDGRASDYRATHRVLYGVETNRKSPPAIVKGSVYAIARTIPGIELGYSTGGGGGLHIASNTGRVKAGKQVTFIDNGSYGGNYQEPPLL